MKFYRNRKGAAELNSEALPGSASIPKGTARKFKKRIENMAIRRRATAQQNRRGRQAGQVSPAGNAVRAGADLFESTAGAIEELWRSGFGMTSHFAERSSSHIARSIGLTDEKAQQATEQSSHNIDAIVQSSRAYADAIQNISRELSSFCRERLIAIWRK